MILIEKKDGSIKLTTNGRGDYNIKYELGMSERDDNILNFYVEDTGIELSQEEVNSLLPYFIKFVETGKLI